MTFYKWKFVPLPFPTLPAPQPFPSLVTTSLFPVSMSLLLYLFVL